jgi:hypothetical protein
VGYHKDIQSTHLRSLGKRLIVAQVVASVLEAHCAFISMGQADVLYNVGNYLSPRVPEFLTTLL